MCPSVHAKGQPPPSPAPGILGWGAGRDVEEVPIRGRGARGTRLHIKPTLQFPLLIKSAILLTACDLGPSTPPGEARKAEPCSQVHQVLAACAGTPQGTRCYFPLPHHGGGQSVPCSSDTSWEQSPECGHCTLTTALPRSAAVETTGAGL